MLSVTVEEIDRQRELGWPDFGPEDFCHRCGGRNIPSWTVDSDRFNLAMGSPTDHQWNGIICPGCFVTLHEEFTGLRCTWKLIPDPTTPFRHYDPDERQKDIWKPEPLVEGRVPGWAACHGGGDGGS